MDEQKQNAAQMHRDGSFQEFLDLLTQTLEQNREYPLLLQQELKKLIKKGKDMVQNIQCQDRQTQTEEQQLSTHGQHRSDSKEDKGEENNVPTSDVSNKPSVEEVEDKVEVVDSRHARQTKTEEQQLPLDGQQRLDSIEDKDEKDTVPTSGVSVQPSMEEVEESNIPSKEVKVIDKKNVEEEEKVEVADSSHTRYLEEELIDCKRNLEAQERKIASLMTRLAHYSEKRAKQDQRKSEDTLSLNRQSTVEQDFKTFTSDERIDAYIMIQKGYKEKTDINAKRLTCMTFEVVYEYVLATKAAMTDAFKEISKYAVDNGPNIGQRLKKNEASVELTIPLCRSGTEYPRDVLDELLLSIKESAPKINTEIFIKDVKQEILRLAGILDRERSCKLNISVKLLDALDDYLRVCIQLAWRMVTQVPPLRLEYHTFTYNRNCHKVVEPRSEVRPERYQGQKVYYLWPGLLDGEGRIISVGEVAPQQ